MVESPQEVFPAAEEENNSGPGESTAGTQPVDSSLSPQRTDNH